MLASASARYCKSSSVLPSFASRCPALVVFMTPNLFSEKVLFDYVSPSFEPSQCETEQNSRICGGHCFYFFTWVGTLLSVSNFILRGSRYASPILCLSISFLIPPFPRLSSPTQLSITTDIQRFLAGHPQFAYFFFWLGVEQFFG
jgi:hypothetical protein